MQAVILAAGMGRRLGELTKGQAKCMVKVNGISLIERMLHILDSKGLSRIVIVVGYQSIRLKEAVASFEIHTPICYVENTAFEKTNNIYSLALAAEYLQEEDTLLLESDLIFEDAIVSCMLEDERETLALVDKYENWMDGTCLVLDKEDNIVDFISGKLLDYKEKNSYYKTVNIYKFSRQFSRQFYLPFLKAYTAVMGDNEYYESVIKFSLLLDKSVIKAKRLDGGKWYEIDDKQDLDIAGILFTKNAKDRYQRMAGRFGGYWRYPHMLDFCYLVNPYFPPEKMMREIASNMGQLLTQYPSGMATNCLLASKNFGIREEHIVVGNGAAELIKELLGKLGGKLGIICPTFEEYANRYGRDGCIVMDTAEMDFTYHSEDIIRYFSGKKANSLVVINPDNPTGNFMALSECGQLAGWCESQGMSLILDESFSDFAEGDIRGNTALTEEFLLKHPNVFVIKSISKSYGVPGLRLGILASFQSCLIDEIKKSVPIWNLNSYAEFFMQVLGKYQQDYMEALKKLKKDRGLFYEGLSDIKGLKVYPSQANYFMCEIVSGMMSESLAAECLERDLLVKDLSSKIGNGKQYIRVAVRRAEENSRLVEALRQIIDRNGKLK
ncbi:MAG: aminotransferase class I/II-fold pyridoxal phosphate-dependent enzyme [Eubacterium sp.]|nr:aminotransferase class I/II-fold pyridoxal phosphate-dependent enzyme [Eubacterium sp.]